MYGENVSGKVIIRGTSCDNNTVKFHEGNTNYNSTVNLSVTLNIDAKTMDAKTLSESIGGVIHRLLGDAYSKASFNLKLNNTEKEESKCLQDR